MNGLSAKMKNWGRKYWLMLLSGLLSALVCLSIMTAFYCRNYAVGTLKNHFENMEKALQSVGYDYAYDELEFYTFSPWQIMRVKNFRIYALDEKDFWQWSADEISIDVGLWDNENVKVFLSSRQSIQRQNHQWEINIPNADLAVRLKHSEIRKLTFAAQNIKVKNLMTVDSVALDIMHRQAPYLMSEFDVKGVRLDDMLGWPLNKTIDHFFAEMYLQGIWDGEAQVSDAFYHWIDSGGRIVVSKAILNWKPLIMVANGDISFNEKLDPTVSLNTASLAMLETLERLNENGFVSNKGAFVAKIVLNNKAVQQKPTDKYKTIVSPLKISKDAVVLENIKIR